MKLPVAFSAVTFAFSLPATVFAGSSEITVEDAWARASIGISRPGAAYMTIRNTGDEAVILTGLSTELALMPDIHRSTTNEQGVTSMSPADDIEIPGGGAVVLEPGGLHAMLMQLQRPMKEGGSFDLTLEFSDGGKAQVEVPILDIAARGPED
ncbi:copper chaperone PCu(A)C [Palleronia sp.]|uniref:copper chaperone PCu(A)C n=1 Tax=Palleronia sp. TaxID=1940284 RepID=UPI0035C84787